MMRNDIIIAALRKEMEEATKQLRSAFWSVGRTLEYDGGRNERYYYPRSQVEAAIQKLTTAASYYDAVADELTRLEGLAAASIADSLDVQRECAPDCAA